jgi:hypothetical protein
LLNATGRISFHRVRDSVWAKEARRSGGFAGDLGPDFWRFQGRQMNGYRPGGERNACACVFAAGAAVRRRNMIDLRALLAVSALGIALFAAAPAFAETVAFKNEMKASEEVPPNDSTATGTVEASLDTATNVLSWTVTYSGLTGPAVAAHFHGPAEPGKNAGPVVPVEGDLASPIKGTATISPEQAADLQAGKWYFNLHTDAHKDGEIRGQLVK